MRTLHIASVLVEYTVLHRFNKHSKKILGKRLREACERLGPAFVKIGQLLSLRYEILSEKDCKELQKLLDTAKAIPYQKVKEIINHDLGKDPVDIFSRFDKNPMASASIAQVHRAKLKTGQEVVVKVRRPYIGRLIEKDMRVLRRLVGFAQLFSPILRHIQATKIMNQLRNWIKQEIDFINEVKNINNINTSYKFVGEPFRKDLGKVVFFNTYNQFCSKNVLTMDYIEGIPLNKFKKNHKLQGYDPVKSMKTFFSGSTRVLYSRDGYYFNGDPHPANIMILKNGDVSSLDCGLIGYFNKKEAQIVFDLLSAVYFQNVEESIQLVLKMSNAPYKRYAPRGSVLKVINKI